jgi:hypothetical protein
LSEFEKVKPGSETDVTKASARLLGLDIDIVHRRSADGESEQISINLQSDALVRGARPLSRSRAED